DGHATTENRRVEAMVDALQRSDARLAGQLLLESHASLCDNFEVSTHEMDRLVGDLAATPGVHGARIVGGGFGGSVLALTEPGAICLGATMRGWVVRPSAGAHV